MSGGTLSLGWRNIWRNRRRTFISMSAIGVGLFLVVFYSGLVGGVLGEAKNELDNAGMGHVEIFGHGYRPKREVAVSMTEPSRLDLPPGAEVSARVASRGLATSARGNEPMQLYGVDFAAEGLVSAHVRAVKQGAVPAADDVHGVLIGEQLADRLGLKVGSKVRLMVARADSEMGADLFRVRGIFHSISPAIGQRQVFVTKAAARELLGVGDVVHQVVVQLPDASQAEAVVAKLRPALGESYDVLSWGELLPVLKRMEALTNNVVLALAFFVYLLVGLGVLNTMLMSVLERTREFGVLLSLGTRPRRVVQLVLAESFWIATLSVVAGASLGALITWWFSQNGLRINPATESLSIGGATISTLVKTRFALLDVFKASTFVYAMALIVGLYPATRITRLQPAEALRRS